MISVVIPVYNTEKYLDKCIESILTQKYNELELILIDDGSTDGSPKICDYYSEIDSRVRTFHQKNCGAASAVNTGISLSKGEYIVVVDCDDYIDGSLLDEVNKLTNDTPDLIIYRFCKFDDNAVYNESFNFDGIRNDENIDEKIKQLVKHDAFYCSWWSKAVRRSFLVDNEILINPDLFVCDIDWYYRVILKAKTLKMVNKPLYFYRQREGSVTAECKIRSLEDSVYTISNITSALSDDKNETNKKDAILNATAKNYCNTLLLYFRIKDKKKKRYYNYLRSNRWLLHYDMNPRVRTINRLYKTVGFGSMMFCLMIANLFYGFKKKVR